MRISLKLVETSRLISFNSSRKQLKFSQQKILLKIYIFILILFDDIIFYHFYGLALRTTKNWQRSWAPVIEHNASVEWGWTAPLQAVTHIQDMEPWQTSGTALCLDSPPLPAWKEPEIGNAAHICRFNMNYLYGLSIPPDWYCEGAGIDEGTACQCPLGNKDGYICFPPPDICTRESPCGKMTVMAWQIFEANWIRKAPLLSSPEPGSSAEGLGEEEKLYLRAQTKRLL